MLKYNVEDDWTNSVEEKLEECKTGKALRIESPPSSFLSAHHVLHATSVCTQISTGYSAGIPYKSGDRRYLVFMMCARKRKRWFFDLFGFGDEEEEKKEKSEAEKEKR